jgi:hypothetical protein
MKSLTTIPFNLAMKNKSEVMTFFHEVVFHSIFSRFLYVDMLIVLYLT